MPSILNAKRRSYALSMILLRIFLSTMVTSCSFEDQLNSDEQTTSIEPITEVPKDNKPTFQPTPPTSDEIRAKSQIHKIARRVIIDLHHRLPSDYELSLFAENSNTLPSLISAFMSHPHTAKAIAEKHRIPWSLHLPTTPDFDHFNLQEDEIELTQDDKLQLISEPIYNLRYLIESKQSFNKILLSHESIVYNGFLNFLTYDGVKTPWQHEPFSLISMDSSFGTIGLLGSKGYLASLDSENQSKSLSKGYRLLKNFTCQNLNRKTSHSFEALNDQDMLNNDFRTIASNRSECSSCHNFHSNQASQHIANLFFGDSLSQWNTPSLDHLEPGYFHGHPYNDVSSFAKILAYDPRFISCEVNNLIAAFLQTPFKKENHTQIRVNIYDSQSPNNFTISNAVQVILNSKQYQNTEFSLDQATSTENTKTDSKNGHTIRFLNHEQLKNILLSLGANSTSIDNLHLIHPVYENTHTSQYNYIPNSLYWKALKSVILKSVKDIISNELNSGLLAKERILFKNLLVQDIETNSEDRVDQQITALWQSLTSQVITKDQEQHKKLKNIWTTRTNNVGLQTREYHLKTWEIILSAVLLSPDFHTY